MPTPTHCYHHRRVPKFDFLLMASSLAVVIASCSPRKPNAEQDGNSETTSQADSNATNSEGTGSHESAGESSTSGLPGECVGIDPSARSRHASQHWTRLNLIAAIATSTGDTSGTSTDSTATDSTSTDSDTSTTSSDTTTESTDSSTESTESSSSTDSTDSTSGSDSESTGDSSTDESSSDSTESSDSSSEDTSDSSDESSDSASDGPQDTGTEDCSIPQDCIGFPSPVWTLTDRQSRSCGFGQNYGIADYQGNVVILMLATGWSPMSQEQAQGLEAMRTMLSDRAVYFLTINADNANSDVDRQPLIDTTHLPIFQDTAIDDVWGRLGGEREDFFVYDQMGLLRHYFGADDSLNLSTPSGYARLRDSVLQLLEAP